MRPLSESPCLTKKRTFSSSQPGSGDICTSAISLTAASVELSPPGLLISTSAASIYSDTRVVYPVANIRHLPPYFFSSSARSSSLVPHRATIAVSRGIIGSSRSVSSFTFPKPMLPVIIISIGTSCGRPSLSRAVRLSVFIILFSDTGMPLGIYSLLGAFFS